MREHLTRSEAKLPNESKMDHDFASLSLEQKIGQLLYIGLPGPELDRDARALIEYVQPGGIIIFGRNVVSPEQLRSLLDQIREMLPVEPLFGIDQEGGLVDRLRKIATPMPPARVIRQKGDLAGARTLGRVTGEMLRLLGFNMNFAPVLSIMTEERDVLANGLYSRSFGRSPGEVLGYAMTYLRGLQGTGCLGCVKHFPGLGAGEVDSHEEMPVIPLSHDDLIAHDLAPYIELFTREDRMVHAVMVGHGCYPNISVRQGVVSGPLIPASINPEIVDGLLRTELGFNELVVTDDLEMGAVAKYYEIEDAAVRAINAGEDMLLICARPDLIKRGRDALLQAAREGRISEERLAESLRRIAEFKARVQPPLPFDLERFRQLSEEIAALNRRLDYTYGGKI